MLALTTWVDVCPSGLATVTVLTSSPSTLGSLEESHYALPTRVKGPELSSPHSSGAKNSRPAPEEATGTQGTQGSPVVGPPGGGRSGCRGAGPGRSPGWGSAGRVGGQPSVCVSRRHLEGHRVSYFCSSRAPEPGEKLAHLSKNDGLSPPFPLPPCECRYYRELARRSTKERGLLPSTCLSLGFPSAPWILKAPRHTSVMRV